jgi:uncharacterized protein YutE (UPF0331/DUF86 family)
LDRSRTLAPTLVARVGLRNILVHGYERVDLGLVRDLVEDRL